MGMVMVEKHKAQAAEKIKLSRRFEGNMPVVIDVETGGVHHPTDALLEVGVVFVDFDDAGQLIPTSSDCYHVAPFEGSNITEEALAINKIEPDHPFRMARPESEVMTEFFELIRKVQQQAGCQRSILVGHNAHFDLGFIRAAADRCGIKQSPLHSFTCYDTATLAALAYGHSVLAKALKAAKIPFNKHEAHSALYDAQCTATLFCKIVNTWDAMP